MPDSRSIYRRLLRFYPARFREEYSEPLERQFADELREAGGWPGRARLWLAAIEDLAVSVPAELLRELRQDLAYAVRAWRQRSLVAGLAFTALALAIGATTGVFSVVNSLLLGSLPYTAPDRLVQLLLPPVGGGHGRAAFTAWRAHSTYLEDAASYISTEMGLAGPQGAEVLRVTETSANYFAVLGAAETEFGRMFRPEEDVAGRGDVAVISHSLWQQRFGGDPRVLGSTIRLNGVPMTVIGVARAGVDYPERTSIWTPTVFDMERLPKTVTFAFDEIGRLKPGVSLRQGAAMLRDEAQRARAGQPAMPGFTREPRMTSLRDQLAGPVRLASLVLLGAVVFVLLIACTNVAHLLLARANERRQELTIRSALGASRARLVQQLVTESVALTLLAAAAGMGVAWWATRLANAAQPARSIVQEYDAFDWRVLGFAVLLALSTGVVFGLLPARLIGRAQSGEELARSQRGSHGAGVKRLRLALTVLQAAFTVVLLAASLGMGRSFLKLLRTDVGFRSSQVVTMDVSLAGSAHFTTEGLAQFYRDALDRIRAIPGVEAAGATSEVPFSQAMFSAGQFRPDNAATPVLAVIVQATGGYFRAMGSDILRGRDFLDADAAAAAAGPAPVIVDESFARAFADTGEVVGRKLVSRSSKTPREIVGVVRTLRYDVVHAGLPQIYVLAAKSPPLSMTIAARVSGRPEAYLALCREAVRGVDRDAAVSHVATLDQRRDGALSQPRFYTTVVLFFGGFALLLAIVGIYGVASVAIAQRTKEIGVRLAVGASAARVRTMLLGQTLAPVLAGLAAGIALAAGFGRLLEHLIAKSEPVGIGLCAAAACALALPAAMAAWQAGRRIAGMDPTAILRAE